MIRDCRLGMIDLILTKSIARFARNTVDSIKAIRELTRIGVAVYFEKERINSLSEKSEQILTILSSLAQGESESISTNNRWAITRRFKNGTYTISDPAYGYANNEDGELVIQKEEAAIVRRIFDSYLGGKGSYAIAKELQEENIPTIRNAKSWQDSVIKGILQNCVYEGDLLQQKTYTTEGVPFIRRNNKGVLPQYLITDNHEPIITREEAEAVRRIYEYRRQKIYIGKPYEKIQWSCHQHIEDITKCGQKAVREDAIRQAFIIARNRLASNYEAILPPMLAALKSVQGDPDQEQELQELEHQIQELKKQSHMLQKVLTGGGIGSAFFIEERNRIDSELET